MNIYGYFDDEKQTEPAYDPGLNVDCPVCGNCLSHPIKTISIMLSGDTRSYFYRTHKDCYDGLTSAEAESLDGRILDSITKPVWHRRFPSEAHNLKLWQPEFGDDEYLEN